ncbi:MAG: SDR family oxidoreductase [Ignavibacteriaceae bacterium]
MHSSKICLITGATSGIGKASAIELAKLGYDLILIGRSESKGFKITEKISGTNNVKAEFFACDISSLNEVRKAAEAIKSKYKKIDVLINNAGSRFDTYQKSADGIELTFATNHLGHFLLTYLLFDNLKKSESARIINVSSSAHSGKKIEIENLVNPKFYNRSNVYGSSKLANILFTYELSRRLNELKITVTALNPGGVASNFAKNNGFFPWLKHVAYHLIKRELITPKQGCQTIIYLASSPEVEGVTGKYFYLNKEIKSSSESYNEETAKKLWKLSEDLSGIKFL